MLYVISVVQEYGTWHGIRIHPTYHEHHHSTTIIASKVSYPSILVCSMCANWTMFVLTFSVVNMIYLQIIIMKPFKCQIS